MSGKPTENKAGISWHSGSTGLLLPSFLARPSAPWTRRRPGTGYSTAASTSLIGMACGRPVGSRLEGAWQAGQPRIAGIKQPTGTACQASSGVFTEGGRPGRVRAAASQDLVSRAFREMLMLTATPRSEAVRTWSHAHGFTPDAPVTLDDRKLACAD